MGKLNAILLIAMALVLAAPGIALADKKKVNNDTPTESLTINYGEIKHTYTTQRDAASGLPTGKRQHKPLTITKEVGPASPKLTTTNSTGVKSNINGTTNSGLKR